MSEIGSLSRNRATPERDASESTIRHWFAAYTTSRHEKRVAQHLGQRAIECYLPLYRTERRWKGRPKVTLDLPLFPSYIFVHIGEQERVSTLEIPGILALVGGRRSECAFLPDFEIEALRAGLDPNRVEPHPLLSVGQRVRICRGSLAGLEGILVRRKNNLRVVLTFETLMQSIAVEVDANDLEGANGNSTSTEARAIMVQAFA
jgi:transcriptional antiterminator NusG